MSFRGHAFAVGLVVSVFVLSGCGRAQLISRSSGLAAVESGRESDESDPDAPSADAVERLCQTEQTRLFGGTPPATTIDQDTVPELTGNDDLLVVTDGVTRIVSYRGDAVIRRKTPTNTAGLVTRINGATTGTIVVCGLSLGSVESDVSLIVVGGSIGSITGDGDVRIYGVGTIGSHTGNGTVERLPL